MSSHHLRIVILRTLKLGVGCGLLASTVVLADNIRTIPGVTVYGSSGGGYYGGGWGGGWGGGDCTEYCGDVSQPGEWICYTYDRTGFIVPMGIAPYTIQCDLKNPPTLVQNGCGSSGISGAVPDYLAAAPQLGNMFTAACNLHDVCYGTYNTNKNTCDAQLATDMYNDAKREIPSSQWPRLEPYVRSQANAYAYGLADPLIEFFFSNDAFNKAKTDAYCRQSSINLQTWGCF
ncbi:hypothetical protein MASR1M8_01040 [Thermomonas brevis]